MCTLWVCARALALELLTKPKVSGMSTHIAHHVSGLVCHFAECELIPSHDQMNGCSIHLHVYNIFGVNGA